MYSEQLLSLIIITDKETLSEERRISAMNETWFFWKRTDDSEEMNRFMFNCKGDNFWDRESLTCYSFELRVKLHKVHRVSGRWLLVKYDRVKN